MTQTNVRRLLIGAALSVLAALPRAAPSPPDLCDPRPAAPVALVAESPLQAIHAHVCGFHFYNGDPRRALRVDHYCSHVTDEILQCIIYDSDRKDARLIGIEYVISERLFSQLGIAEKQLWHSHRYEVMSGLLTAPDLSASAETALMKDFAGTYGKTWHLWQVDRGDALPLGLPKLMMGFTADGQVDPTLVARRDGEQPRNTAAAKARRADLPGRPIAEGADAWQHGRALQIDDDLLQPPQPPLKP
jgi:hypothetical protein